MMLSGFDKIKDSFNFIKIHVFLIITNMTVSQFITKIKMFKKVMNDFIQ